MKLIILTTLATLLLSKGEEKSVKLEFIVVVSDFSCKACHKDILNLYDSVKQENRTALNVYYITHESLSINIKNNTEELAKIYRRRPGEVVVLRPEVFLQQFPLSQEDLSRSPFILLKNKESTLVICQKDLTMDGETERIIKEIKDFYK